MRLQELYLIAKKLNAKKISNALKVVVSFYAARHSKKEAIWGMPISLNVEPTTHCNLRCPECPSGLRSFSRPTGMLEEKMFQNIIDQVKDKLIYLTFYFQGEPFLNPRFPNMVRYASDRGIFTFTSTNAHFIDEENAVKIIQSGLDKLIISMDGTTQEVFEKYRVGGQLEKVLEGTRNMVRLKKKLKSKTPYLVIQFLVVRHNEHQVEEARKLTKELGVDEIKFKTAQIENFQLGNDLIPHNQKYSRYQKKKDGQYQIKNSLLNRCWKLWSGSVMTWDGKILPCCFDKDAKYDFGNIQSEPFKEIWKGENYQKFRQQLLKSRSSIDICTNCSEGTKVWSD